MRKSEKIREHLPAGNIGGLGCERSPCVGGARSGSSFLVLWWQLRSRVEYRRRTHAEQEKSSGPPTIRGAADAEGFPRP